VSAGQSPPRVERRLAAILAADVVGSSRLMEIDEEETIGPPDADLDSLRSHPRFIALLESTAG
jgi:hypothetical protein